MKLQARGLGRRDMHTKKTKKNETWEQVHTKKSFHTHTHTHYSTLLGCGIKLTRVRTHSYIQGQGRWGYCGDRGCREEASGFGRRGGEQGGEGATQRRSAKALQVRSLLQQLHRGGRYSSPCSFSREKGPWAGREWGTPPGGRGSSVPLAAGRVRVQPPEPTGAHVLKRRRGHVRCGGACLTATTTTTSTAATP